MNIVGSLKGLFQAKPRPQIHLPAFGEPPVQQAVDFSFPLDKPDTCQLANKDMCKPERTPGLVNVLKLSQASPIEQSRSINEAVIAGLRIAGPAIGIPGIASLHFLRDNQSIQFYGLDANQEKVPLRGKLLELPYRIELNLDMGRKIEIGTETLYPTVPPRNEYGQIDTGPFGLPIPESFGVQIKSSLRDAQQGITDCLTTTFDGQGRPVQTGYKRQMSDFRTLSVSLKRDENPKIQLSQGGSRDDTYPEQNITITSAGIHKEVLYHSMSDPYPF